MFLILDHYFRHHSRSITVPDYSFARLLLATTRHDDRYGLRSALPHVVPLSVQETQY